MSNLQFTERYLTKVEVDTIKQMQAILTRENRNATHRLYNSFQTSLDETPNGFLIKMEYATHGKYVLDDKRRITRNASYNKQNPKDPTTVIGQLINWILNKGISVGGGKIRTPLKKSKYNQGGSSIYSPKTEAEQQNPYPELTSFAFAIFNNIKKRGRTFTPSTNFLKPYQNLIKNRTFKIGLMTALAKDGTKVFSDPVLSGKNEIKIHI